MIRKKLWEASASLECVTLGHIHQEIPPKLTRFRGHSQPGEWGDMVQGEPSIAIDIFQHIASIHISTDESL